MKRRRPTDASPRRRPSALLLSLALSAACLPRPASAKKGKGWHYDAAQCGLLLSVASSADINGSGGLDSSESRSFYADLLAKSSATEGPSPDEPDDWPYEEFVCACRYTYRLDWACCDDTASVDDLKLDGADGGEGAGLVFPFGEIPLPDRVVSANPENEYWASRRTDFERKFCREMFKVVEGKGGGYDLDMSLGAANATTTEAPAGPANLTTTEAAADSTSTAATTTPAAVATTEEATTTSTTAPPQSTTESTAAAASSEPSTTTPTTETPQVDAPPSELDNQPASASSSSGVGKSSVRSANASAPDDELSAGAFVGIALATLLVLLLASALIVRRRRREQPRGGEAAVAHEALDDPAGAGGGAADDPDGSYVGEVWHDEESDAGGNGGDGGRTSSAAGTLAAMGVASTVATRLTTGESEVMLTERVGWSRVEPVV